MPLTDLQIKHAPIATKPNGEPNRSQYRLADGQGMYLEVRTNGSKLWFLKYRMTGKEKRIGLGSYPATTAAMARERREEARRQIASGIDPLVNRKVARALEGVSAANTFESLAREWHDQVHRRKVSVKHADRNLRRLEIYAFPKFGSIPVKEITAPMVLAAMRVAEGKDAIETAHRTLTLCRSVFAFAMATGRSDRNPVADADLHEQLLTPIKGVHAAIIDPGELAGLLRAIDGYTGFPATVAALKLAPLVMLRPGELRQAEWSEIDLDAGIWMIPSARMKGTKQNKATGDSHLVPLARQSVAILRDLHAITGRSRYVFPSTRDKGRPMSDGTINAALQRMGYDTKTQMTGHGFRAMARTLGRERLRFDPELLEAQLAHAKRGPLGASYDRTKFVTDRIEAMQQWADYLDRLRSGSNVVPLARTA
jgi:integrase